MLNEMQGTLTPDGTIILEGKPTLPAGPVKVRIETMPTPAGSADWEAFMRGRDPVAMQKACDDMDRRAEKNAILYPGPDVGVDIIREMRDNRHPQGNEPDET